MSQSWASVSVVMTVVNEERHLRDSVERLLAQDYPGAFEIVIAVGPSKDRTRQVADAIAAENPHVHVVDNPSGRTPTGLNAAIAHTSSEIVVRIDGHAMVPPDYVSTGVRTLEETGADNVGGIMAAEGTTRFERGVARAMTSRFGVGVLLSTSAESPVRPSRCIWAAFAGPRSIGSAATTSRWSAPRTGR